MKKLMLVFFVLAIPWAVSAQFFSLQGKIIEKETGKPLPDARITIGDLDLFVRIAQDGTFRVDRLRASDYAIKVSHVGYRKLTKNIVLDHDVEWLFEMEKDVVMSEEVIIRASRISDDTPGTYTNIPESQLRENNFGQDLPYLLKLTPSVVTTSDAGTGIGYTGIRIRGSDLTRINVTLNGVPVNDPESHNVFFVDLPDLASSVNDIQIQRGVGTSNNGAAAFGASINIQTTQLKDKAYAEISSAYGSFNTFKNTLQFGTGKMKNNFAFDGRFSSVLSDGYIDRASANLRSAYFSGGYFGEKTIVKGLINMGKEVTYQSWEGIPEEMLETDRTYNPAGEMYDRYGNFAGFYRNQVDDYQQNYFQLHIAHEINPLMHLSAATFFTHGFGFYESYKNDRYLGDYGFMDFYIGGDTLHPAPVNLIQQKWLDNDFYGGNASMQYHSEQLELIGGIGWNQYKGDHFGYVIWSEFTTDSFIDQPWYENTGTKTDFNAFVRANYLLNTKLSIYGDGQYRFIDYHIEGIHDDLRDLTQQHRFPFFNPKAGLYYTIDEYHHVYLSFGMSHREPNRTVYREADPSQIENIKAEQLLDYEAGYKFMDGKVQLELNAFYMDYNNQLVLTGQINDVGAAIMTNVPQSFRVGVELSSKLSLFQSLDWYFTTTYSSNKIKNYTAYIDNWDYWNGMNQPIQFTEEYELVDISFSPNLTGASSIVYSGIKNFSVSLNALYVSRQYIDNTQQMERSLDPYHVHDLRLSYGFSLKNIKRIECSIQLLNLLNHEYETNAWVYRYFSEGIEGAYNGYYPQAGFHVMGGVRITL